MHKVALTGCGRISKNHIESLLKLREEGIAEIVSCCDVIPERAQEAAENPEIVHTAPHNTIVSRLDETLAARKPVVRWEP